MPTPLNGSLLKGFDVLRLFATDRPEIAATAVQSELGLNAATAHRFLATLEEAGAIVSVRRGWYRLGYTLSDLGRLAEETNPILPAVRPLVEDLSRSLSESVMVCRLGRSGPTCLLVAEADRAITVSIRIGTTLALMGSAQGRIWLSDLSPERRDRLIARCEDTAPDAVAGLFGDIRAKGYAVNRGDAEPEIGAVAVPVRTSGGRLVLTLSTFGPVNRITNDFATAAVPRLQSVAAEIGSLF